MNLRQTFLLNVAQTSPAPLLVEVDRAEGLYLYGPNGEKFLDLIAGIGVSCLGHRHPAVLAAIQAQLDRYLHTLVYGEMVLTPQVELARLLVEHLPAPLDSVYFVNSGSEATEGAMKLVRRFTGRPEIVAAQNAYHGSTQGAASLMEPTFFTRGYFPLVPGIRHIRFNREEDLENITTQTAGVLIETVQAEAGIYKPHPGYLQALRQRCDETDALLILDEAQTGYGRTGTLWAFEAYGIRPDVLLLAKGMGGGMPLGAFIASREVMGCLSSHPVLGHITTFGGHPVSCAASVATLQTLVNGTLIKEVAEKEALFRQYLVHPDIVEVRSAGLMMAVEMPSAERVQGVIRTCLERGVLTDWFLFNDRSLRIAPPLTIDRETIQEACQIIVGAMA